MDDFALPGYVVEDLVGFGGSGEVWRARDSSTGELVALKRLQGNAASALSTQQLQREAALLATVRHDHVIALRSVVPTIDGLVLVLEYAAGGSLGAVLGVRGRLSAGEVVTIGAPLATALADIHARGLVHGDITPGNIVFDGSGKPLLADLGVARLIGERSGPVGRTPGYADPALNLAEESGDGVADATPVCGPPSDVHGLAAVCFAALAGVPPYAEFDPMVAQSLQPLAPGAPPTLVAAIEAALDSDPSARPDAATFGRALFASCSPVAVRLSRASQSAGGTEAAKTETVAGSVRAVAPVPDSGPGARPRRGLVGRHRWSASRRVLVSRAIAAACVLGLLGAAVVVGVAWGWADHGHRASASVPALARSAATNSESTPPTGAASSPAIVPLIPVPSVPIAALPSSSTDWEAVLGALDRSRDSAFADADANELDAIYVAGSAALVSDRASLGRLVAAGQRVQGLEFVLASVRVVAQSPGEVTLAVTDTLASYEVVDTGGAATPVDGRGARNWTVVLRAQPASSGPSEAPAGEGPWRIASITPGG